MTCTIREAKAGCREISRHVAALCEGSEDILDTLEDDSKPEKVRSAYVLTLVALEETGKMFDLWQNAAMAESSNHATLTIVDWKDHNKKGGIAGDLCCQMFGFIVKFARDLPKTSAHIDESIEKLALEASNHLSRVYPNFKQYREAAIYVDLNENDWASKLDVSPEIVRMDNALLALTAEVAKWYLDSRNPSFSLAVRALAMIRDGKKGPEIVQFAAALALGASASKEEERV